MGTDLTSAVPEGERLRYDGDLRRGGAVGFTDERLLVVRDGEATSLRLASVESVELQSFDWFLGVLSLALVAFGVYSTRLHLLGGLAFAAAGVASLYWTYHKRSKATVHVHDRAKPLTLYPADPEAFYDAFGRALDQYRARVEAEEDRESVETDGT